MQNENLKKALQNQIPVGTTQEKVRDLAVKLIYYAVTNTSL